MEKEMGLFDRAVIFATKAHSGVNRKGTTTPYITHPMEAAVIVTAMLCEDGHSLTESDCRVMAAAVLHDVVEDTDFTKEDVETEFGPRVADLVAAESEKKAEGGVERPWTVRKQETLDHLERETDIDVLRIAFADKLSNLRAIARDLRVYRGREDEFWSRFNVSDSSSHAWYYRGIYDRMTCFEDSALYQEYGALLREVFGCV